jgi:His-Xaa-Ser system radical SAM maturase HxsC
MCPQPPKSFDEKTFHLAQKILTLSPSGFKGEICLTGVEPTLCGNKMLDILAACKIRHPEACIIILTNGKRFRDFSFAKRFAQFGTQTTVAVSLHADTDTLHDRIVGVSGSFHKTQQGIYNLAKLGQRIEIRIVVNKINHVRLLQIAKHIYRNYPFAAHVTFMALEVTGNAVGNFESIWVDPIEYSQHLEIALHELHRNGMYVSAYNHPLCLLPKQAWPYARKSISSWKEAYLPVCDLCRIRENCCGVFSTSNDRLSKNIHPIVD